MKKVLVFVMCLLMTLPLFGCGKEEPPAPADLSDEGKIESAIRSREKEYPTAGIDRIEVKQNLGASAEGDYIALVYMNLDPMSKETGNEIMEMVSDDIAANLHKEGFSNVIEVAVFWEDAQNGREGKFAYLNKDGGFEKTESLILKKPN